MMRTKKNYNILADCRGMYEQEIIDTITEDKLAKTQKFDDDYAEFNKKMTSIRNKFDMWKTKAIKEVSALKIYLPQGPKQTYDEINK